MNNSCLIFLASLFVIFAGKVSGQTNGDLAFSTVSSGTSGIGNSAAIRNCKKLSATYTGFAIEVAISDYPLSGDDRIFRFYGNIQYDKRPEGWYSYVIPAKFSNEASAKSFLKEVIWPQVEDARLIDYKEGNRKVLHP
jgi:hypothetical protein